MEERQNKINYVVARIAAVYISQFIDKLDPEILKMSNNPNFVNMVNFGLNREYMILMFKSNAMDLTEEEIDLAMQSFDNTINAYIDEKKAEMEQKAPGR